MKIKYIAAFAALILITGCNQLIAEKDLSKAMTMCADNAGLHSVRFYDSNYKIYCNNGYTYSYGEYGD